MVENESFRTHDDAIAIIPMLVQCVERDRSTGCPARHASDIHLWTPNHYGPAGGDASGPGD
jgi:hypothetical protein